MGVERRLGVCQKRKKKKKKYGMKRANRLSGVKKKTKSLAYLIMEFLWNL